MATATGNKSGSFNGTYPQYATPYIFWSYDQSIPNNNTVLTATLKVKREKTGSTTNKASTPWSITIGGTKTSGTISFKITNVSAGEYITIGSASKTISHNSDGSCSAISISATIDISGTTLGTGSVSTSVTPSTIPRASTPTLSASSVAMGSSVTINTNRVSSSFTHTITYKFGSASGTIASNVGTSTTWTPPLSLASQIPNATSGTCTITCQTYNGSTLIGTKTVTVTLTVPSSVVPSISSIALSAGNSNVPSSWGVYMQGKSTLKVVTSASGSYGSSIKSYKITGIDNNTYYSSNFTSSTLQTSGTRTITATVTDSRGRTATKTTTYTCVAYSNPSITTATVTRCNSDGTANEEGTYVKYSFTANVAPVSNKNTYSYRLGYKNSTGSSYTYITISNSAYTLSKSNIVISGVAFSVDNSYDFQFLVNDYFTSTSVIKNIGTGFTLMDFNASGKGMAIGKVSEKDALEIGLPTEFIGGINAILITNNMDLNDIKKAGFYYCPTDATAATLKNCPSKNAFSLLVEQHAGVKQTLTQYMPDISHKTYERNYYGYENKWGEWKVKPIYTGNRNTTDTYVPVFVNGHLDYTLRRFYNNVQHTNWNVDQDHLATMEFLSFWNGAYDANNSSNLTYCYQGTIQAKPKSLYDNSSGSNGSITLSESSANFTFLEIHCKTNSDHYFSTRIYNPSGKWVALTSSTSTAGTTVYLKTKCIGISGTSIWDESKYNEAKLTTSVSTSQYNNIYITKVLGYK